MDFKGEVLLQLFNKAS